jgi:integrase
LLLDSLTASATTARLAGLARRAWRVGLLPHWQPTRSVRVRRRRALPAPPGSLLAALAARELPGLNKQSRQGTKDRSCAVRLFGDWLKRPALPGDCTRENLRGYQQWLIDAGRLPETAACYASQVVSVARAIDPEQYPDRRYTIRTTTPTAAGSLREFAEQIYRVERVVKPRQWWSMVTTFRLLYLFLGRELPLVELSNKIVVDFMAWLTARGQKPNSVNKHRAHLLAFWRYAEERGRIDTLPRVRKLRAPLDAPDAFTEEEIARIIAAPYLVNWTRRIEGIPAADYLHALLLVVYWTALRRRAIFALRCADLDLATGWLTVRGSAMKNGRGKRFRLGADALAALARIWRPERELIFPHVENSRFFYKRLNRVFEAAGVPRTTGRKLAKLHKIRRTSITLVAKYKGLVAAQEHAGHSSATMTARYIDPSFLPGQDATEYLPVVTAPRSPH